MPSAGQFSRSSSPLKRRRQDPVSCQFCRSKKLKCNRQQPCSNCIARGLTCDGQFPPRLGSPPQRSTSSSADADTASILLRLKRLEEIVIGPSRPSASTSESPSSPIQPAKSSPVACLSPTSEYEEALHSLEETKIRKRVWTTPGSTGVEHRFLSAQHTSITYGFSQSLSDRSPQDQPAARCILLPPKDEASALLEIYLKYIDDLQHVTYVPTVRNMIETLYARLAEGLAVTHSHVALLLTMLANAAALCSFSPISVPSLFSGRDPSQVSAVWANEALEVLDLSNRTTSGSLEDVQAGLILAFLFFHTEGIASNARWLFTRAISTARCLSLHKLDAPSSQSSASSAPGETAEIEIKRRVWWHLTSTDWVLGLSGGPQEGTYLVQPRHIRVNRPRNIDDKDLERGGPLLDRPLSEPTMMSYYIQRIKFAEICRSVVDLMPLASLDLSTVDYNEVIALDRRFEAFLEELPPFLRTDEKSRLESEHILRRYPQMRVQSYALGMVVRTRRCKLHQPFLIRRPVGGPRYDYSREMSLLSARTVIRLKRQQEQEWDTALAANVKLIGTVYHVFMATIVLVMDLCFNKADGDDTARKAEVAEACQVMEEAARQSPVAREFFDSLTNVLRKHKVRLCNFDSTTTAPAPAPASDKVDGPKELDVAAVAFGPRDMANPYVATDPSDVQQSHATAWPLQGNFQNGLANFDDLWKEYVAFGPNMDMPEWDNLFSDLDSRFE